MNSRYRKHGLSRVHQCDIYKDIEILFNFVSDDTFEVMSIPSIIVLSQDCDLEQDYKKRSDESDNQDKFLPSIILTPLYSVGHFKEGKHLEEHKLTMGRQSSQQLKSIKQNNNYRYHYLEGSQEYQVADSIIDFKHFYTIPREFFYKKYFNNTHYLASLNFVFREHLSHRFCHYLSRIGLPNLTVS